MLAAVLPGCGTSGGPSRAEWAQRAGAACGPALRQQRALASRIDQVAAGSDPAQIFTQSARLLRRSQQVTQAAFARIDALETPADDRDAIKAWIAANRRRGALTGRLAGAFAAQDQKAIALLSQDVDALDARGTAAARGLGASACAGHV